MSRWSGGEETWGKAYDGRLMRRLLRYARAHAWAMALGVFLALLATAAELAGPYLVKVAIDEHFTQATRFVRLPEGAAVPDDLAVVRWGTLELVRLRDARAAGLLELWPDAMPYTVVRVDGDLALVEGDVPPNATGTLVFGPGGRGVFRTADGATLPAHRLGGEEALVFWMPTIQAVLRIAAGYLGVLAAAFVLGYSQMLLLAGVSQRIIQRLRHETFAHLLRLPLAFLDRHPTGRLVTRVTNDTETLNEMYANVLVNVLRDGFMLVGIVGVMMALDWRLALLALTTVPLVLGATVWYRRAAREAFRRVRQLLSTINGALSETLSGIRIVHLFHRQRQQYAQLEAINREHYAASLRELQLTSLFRPVMDFVYALGLAALLWWGGGAVVRGAVTFGVLYAFIEYLNRFFKPINDLAERYTILQQAMASAERIFQLLDEPNSLPDPPEPVPLTRVRGEVAFRNVWFAYRDEEWVLKDISFTVQPGETIALVGATGAGKSTILQLLCRFYDVQRGAVLIDGIDVRRLRQADLRRHIGFVLQDAFLFSGTIRDNIRLFQDDVTDEAIERVCRAIGAHDFIARLPGGYDAPVLERGSNLSAGQRQLIAFARALVRDPAILVLDEATAHVDTETERLVQEALLAASRGRTTIIIAHRLATVRHADRILVLHKGRIREMGTHDELMRRGGLYRTLVELQARQARLGGA